MKWNVLAVVVVVARTGFAQPGAQPAATGPCKDADAYRDALALHRSWKAKACVNDDDDCAEQQRALATLTDLQKRCAAGEDVGSPPTQFPRPAGTPEPVATGDSFAASFEGLVGGGLPLGNSTWSKSVGPSPTVAARFGVTRGAFGALLSAELTAEQLADSGGSIVPSPTNSQQMRRYRFLAMFTYEQRPVPALAVGVRAGVGVDYADASFNRSETGMPVSQEGSDTGLAAEVGAAAWWQVGPGTDLGATFVVPIASHGGSAGEVNLSYTSFDLELLVGVRVGSHR